MRLAATVTTAARRLLDLALLALIVTVLGTVILARVVPEVTGATTLVIAGGSMEPTIPIGAAAVIRPVAADELRVGDVVSLTVGGQTTFTHRIVRLVDRDGAVWLATQGDANPEPDPSIVPATAVIGRLDVAIPFFGYLITLLSAASGVLFVLGIAGSLLAAGWLLESLELDQKAARLAAESGLAGVRPAVDPADVAEDARIDRSPVHPDLAHGEPIAARAAAAPARLVVPARSAAHASLIAGRQPDIRDRFTH